MYNHNYDKQNFKLLMLKFVHSWYLQLCQDLIKHKTTLSQQMRVGGGIILNPMLLLPLFNHHFLCLIVKTLEKFKI